jgi:polysaccharide pyruvyl transferase WcaK-like protein
MIDTDEQALLDLENHLADSRFRMLRYNKDFRIARALIAETWVCITMKHHPIIFALGERVPAISLSHGAYYEHKNVGALDLFGLADCSIRLEQDDCLNQFETIYRRLNADRAGVVKRIEEGLPPLYARRKAFFDDVSSLLAGRRESSQ